MFNRRSFFRRFAAVVAVVALAPEIAFQKRLEIPAFDEKTVPFWFQTSRFSYCESGLYREYRDLMLQSNADYRKHFDLPEPKSNFIGKPIEPIEPFLRQVFYGN